jgi:single-strand DNA-binding protein
MLNKATLIGNVGRDPEIRNTNSGKMVANISVATSSGSGENKKTEWHRVTLWEKSAEICQSYVQKGTLVYIEGMIQTRKWQDKDGNDKYSTEIVVGGYGSQIRTLKDGVSGDGAARAAKAETGEVDPPYDLGGDDL